MPNSAQLDNLIAKLEEGNCTVDTLSAHAVDQETTHHLWLVYRGDRPPVRVIVIDQITEGYSLYLEQPTMKIDDDVLAITQARTCQTD